MEATSRSFTLWKLTCIGGLGRIRFLTSWPIFRSSRSLLVASRSNSDSDLLDAVNPVLDGNEGDLWKTQGELTDFTVLTLLGPF